MLIMNSFYSCVMSLLAIVGSGAMLSVKVLVEQILLHRHSSVGSDSDLKYLGIECHMGYVFQHNSSFDRLGCVFPPSKRSVRVDQYPVDTGDIFWKVSAMTSPVFFS